MRLPRVSVPQWLLVGILVGAVVGSSAAAFVALQDGGVDTSGRVVLGTNTGLDVTVEGDTNVSMSDAWKSDRRVAINTTGGNVSIAADASASATIHAGNFSDATWTNVTEISAGATWMEVYPENRPRTDVRGDIDQIAIRNRTLDDGTADFWVEGTDGGTATVRMYDLPANTAIGAINQNGNYLDSAQTDANGNVTLDIGLSAQTVELVTVGEEAPTLSNNQPTGTLPTEPNEISVDVNDAEFPGEQVEVNIWLDGSLIHTENVTENTTVTTSNFGTLDFGEHTYNISATDAGGLQDTVNASFALPANVAIRSESNASNIITGQSITLTAFSEDGTTVVKKTDQDQDGIISLEGLPATEYVFTFAGSEDYYERRVYIESITQEQNIYLLNKTELPIANDSAIETTFVYEDRTNQFSQENTTLEVQRAVDVNNDSEFQWTTVAGDFWGAAGEFPFTGEANARYRLTITNRETGESRVLGTHIPTSDGVKQIIVGKIIFGAEDATGRVVDAGVNTNTSNLQVYYNDPGGGTTDLNVTVHEQGNASNVLYQQTFPGPLGEKVVLIDVNQSQIETSWVVEYRSTVDGQQEFDKIVVGGGGFPLPIDADILASFGYLMITFVMLLYGPRTAVIGAWSGVALLAGMAFLGWLSPVSVFIPGIVAIGVTLYSEASV